MLRTAMTVGVIAAFLLCTPAAWAGIELIVIEKPFHARHLSGVVVDAGGAAIPGVLVEECDTSFSPLPANGPIAQSAPMEMLWDCDRDPRHILASTTTDANVYFAFPQAKRARTHYLHLRLAGFNPMHIAVKTRLFAKASLRIQLEVST